MSESSGWDDLRGSNPTAVIVGGICVVAGSRVRLRPRAAADIMDAALAGRLARVESIEVTTDGEPHLIVTVDDDPGREFGGRRYVGHRFFFRSDEIEPIGGSTSLSSRRGRVLIAGIGNIFFGDDGFGVATARRLAAEAWPDGVIVRDFGIRGLDLAYALQEDFDAAVLIDALPRGAEPGSLHVLEPDLDAAPTGETLDAHVMDPVRVLRLARALGRVPRTLVVVGCEPLTIEGDEPPADDMVALSPPVRHAVEAAAALVKRIVRGFTSTELHASKEYDDVDSGLGLGDTRNHRGRPDHLDDSHANPANAPVLPDEGDVVRP